MSGPDMLYAEGSKQPFFMAPAYGTVQMYKPQVGTEYIEWDGETPWEKDLHYAQLDVNDLTYSVDPSFTYNYGFEVPHTAKMKGQGKWEYPNK